MQWINQQILDQLGQDAGYDLLPQLIDLFIADGELTLQQMDAAVQARDVEALLLLAHTLKSVCATYGANQSHLEAKAMEMACRQQRWDAIAQYLAALKYSIPASSDDLRGLVSEHSLLSH